MSFAKEKKECFSHSSIIRKYARVKHKSVSVKKKKIQIFVIQQLKKVFQFNFSVYACTESYEAISINVQKKQHSIFNHSTDLSNQYSIA